MLNNNNKKKILALFLFSMIFLTVLIQNNLISNWNNDTNLDKELSSDEQTDLGNIKANEVLTDEIRINASATGVGAHNWTWAQKPEQGYVTPGGNGSQANPYVIENLEIDGQNLHSGIIIENSYNWGSTEYFRIENNVIYNVGGTDSDSAGIKIYKSRWGSIRKNNISSNKDGNYGIHVIGDGPWGTNPSEKINITENNISDTERGIYLQDGCRDITISENIAENNYVAGIYIKENCRRLTISNNIIRENTVFGIYDSRTNNMMPPMMGDGNTISYNIIYNNKIGLYLSRTHFDIISYNNISSNSEDGLYIASSSRNKIANNTITDNGDRGIIIGGDSRLNKIYGNNFLRNDIHAVEDTNIFNWWEYNNWSWWEYMGSIIGNYWDDYSGDDTDDDGVGDSAYIFEGNQDKYPIWNDGIEGHIIFINGTANGVGAHNWTWAKDRFWCTGIGESYSPYVIGPNDVWDGVIDARGNNFAIEIVDSMVPKQYFKIQGLTIINSTEAGIRIENINAYPRIIINNNISFNNGHGISLRNSRMVNITDNIISNNNWTGIYLYNGTGGPSPIIVKDNTVTGNGDDGIYIGQNSDNNYITGNIIENNGKYGINVNETTIWGCNDTTIENNILRENTLNNARDTANDTRWYLGGRGNDWGDYIGLGGLDDDDDGIGDIPYNISLAPLIQDIFPICDDGFQEYPLFINDSAGAWNNWEWASKRLFVSGSGLMNDPYVIENVRFNGDNSDSPIKIIRSSAYFRIENCILDNIGSGEAGIFLNETDNGELIDNTFSSSNGNNYGIYIARWCNEINITDNVIQPNPTKFKYGIYMEDISMNNYITGNTIKDNDYGVYIDYCDNINITENEVSGNTVAGIVLNNSCTYTYIFNNNISSNPGSGIIIDTGESAIGCHYNYIFSNDIKNNSNYGLYINSSFGIQYNEIYYNNFSYNGMNAQDDTPISDQNRWYNDANNRGNYWSNYTPELYDAGVKDELDDGIGDIEYNITGSNKAQDKFPIYDDGHNGSRVVINGAMDWPMISLKTWCTGSGTWNDPYIIEGLRINGQLNSSCILIYNSFVYFRIENCWVFNSSKKESPTPAGGISLDNVANGVIQNNNLSNNDGHGILIRSTSSNSYNNIIRNNIIENNNGSGVYINGSMCYNNVIDNNTVSYNAKYGIVTSDWAYNNNITKNTLNDNTEVGIFIEEGGWWGNSIFNNTVRSGSVGIGIDGYNGVDIFYNHIYDTSSHGIAIQYSNTMMMMDIRNINISGNIIHDCGEDGINFGWNNSEHSLDNRITENYIYSNTYGAGISLTQFDNSMVVKNTLEQNYIGITLESECSFSEFRDNFILNNSYRGFTIEGLECVENRIYNNNFTGNGLNGFDWGQDNHWYWMNIGNYWYDYTGTDPDDDGIGGDFSDPFNRIDIAYNISGLFNSKDMFPELWDAPVILKTLPVDDDEFPEGVDPDYEIKITEGLGKVFWYEIYTMPSMTLHDTSSYMMLNGNPGEVRTGKIEHDMWSPLSNGTYTIRFYVNDSQGKVGYTEVIVEKLSAVPLGTVIVSDGSSSSSSSSDDSTSEEEELMPWYIQAAMTGAVSATAGLIIKQVYSSAKKRRIILEKIHENFAKVENLEKFLKENLDYESWQRFEEPWKQYQSEEITERKLIKKAKSTLGKQFTELFIPHKKSRRRTTRTT